MKKNIILVLVLCLLISPVIGITVTSGSGIAYVDQAPIEINIMMDSAPTGLSGYTMNISLSNNNATISGLSLPSWAAVWDSSSTPTNEIQISAADINDNILPGATNILLATLEITALEVGSAPPNIVFSELDDDVGSPITVTIEAALITFEGGLRPKASQTLEELDEDAYDLLLASMGGTQQLNESVDIDWFGLKAAAEHPYVTAIGSLFYVIVFSLPFLMQWLRQGSMAIPGVIGIILGGVMLAKIPPEYHIVAVAFLALSILAIVWAILKEWR